MSIGYLFRHEEFVCIKKLRQGERASWSKAEQNALKSLEKKGCLTLRNGVLYVEPLILFFLDILEKPDQVCDVGAGALYRGRGIYLWNRTDERRLSGFSLRPYPSLEAWYEEAKEETSQPLEYYRKEMGRHG